MVDILKLPLKLFIKIIAVILGIALVSGILELYFKNGFFEGFILTFFGLASTALLIISLFLIFLTTIDLLTGDYKKGLYKLGVVVASLSIYAVIFLNTISTLF
ncbi:hypothetical protein DFQ11_101855 [Winogradskyella epiphytica]|uniref:Uncharacterized protein n=1 Tax=Winogradskyella epiphytica TaxID=262005 RepID=A0A2V4XJC1_9FLAO|nr:hypothetical protein [Winogradskyella epiphytica]PYE83420.1 hypothetical protein DFQ11_101855 [Winogradskyella epiphytica]GGW58032.1 hypothetical protein GCM10008085_07130 [Winogradskyella epiphytica]